eukprot:CAMPEP_0172458962 /NCGR_PEP_ID=MMETSP1065-20121228/30270_1 /TAXON_ID=265537 /ORGANISM="Amphiprora paludosa, Strain CCMP125" /LENGTH=354 /DNA_ID=CAMNT_0013213465 /DNA_START=21 /DNA_END=1085 /DNA_ORIENTATION=+
MASRRGKRLDPATETLDGTETDLTETESSDQYTIQSGMSSLSCSNHTTRYWIRETTTVTVASEKPHQQDDDSVSEFGESATAAPDMEREIQEFVNQQQEEETSTSPQASARKSSSAKKKKKKKKSKESSSSSKKKKKKKIQEESSSTLESPSKEKKKKKKKDSKKSKKKSLQNEKNEEETIQTTDDTTATTSSSTRHSSRRDKKIKQKSSRQAQHDELLEFAQTCRHLRTQEMTKRSTPTAAASSSLRDIPLAERPALRRARLQHVKDRLAAQPRHASLASTRRERAYQTYLAQNKPTKEALIVWIQTRTQHSSTEAMITETDVELLPWTAGGTKVDRGYLKLLKQERSLSSLS